MQSAFREVPRADSTFGVPWKRQKTQGHSCFCPDGGGYEEDVENKSVPAVLLHCAMNWGVRKGVPLWGNVGLLDVAAQKRGFQIYSDTQPPDCPEESSFACGLSKWLAAAPLWKTAALPACSHLPGRSTRQVGRHGLLGAPFFPALLENLGWYMCLEELFNFQF